MYLLNTDTLLKLFLFEDDSVLEKFNDNINNCYTSTIVLIELYKEIEERCKQDSNHRGTLEEVQNELGEKITEWQNILPVVSFDQAAAHEFIKIQGRLNNVNKPTNLLKVLIAAVARSRNHIIVTNQIGFFRNIDDLLLLPINTWIESNGYTVYGRVGNEPGVLHRVAQGLAGININIQECMGSVVVEGSNSYCSCSMKIIIPPSITIENLNSQLNDIALGISNIRVETNDTGENCLRLEANLSQSVSTPSVTPGVRIIVRGIDRVGLLADVTEPLYIEEIDISSVNAYISTVDSYFYIYFTCSESERDWDTLIQTIEDINGVTHASYNEVL